MPGCTDTDDDKPAQSVSTKACRQIYQMIKAVSQGGNILSPSYIPVLYDIVNPPAVTEAQAAHRRAEAELDEHCLWSKVPAVRLR